MSYLDIPRIHFGGQFFTDPSTINNDPTHYDPNCKTPSPWQNPNGQHRFQFVNCLIKAATDMNGDVPDDPIIGCSIITTDNPSPARIVDIDVYQQAVSALYGLELKITLPDGNSIVGKVDTPVLNDVSFFVVLPTRSWESGDYVQDSFGGDMNAAGWFQSVIRVKIDAWSDLSSPVLNALRSKTKIEDGHYLISIKFELDGYQNVPQDKDYLHGRIVGTLGPVFDNEPLYNPGQRWMQPRAFSDSDPWNYPSFNRCPFKVDNERKKLVLDLANSICRQTAGGDPVDLGTLTAMVSNVDPPNVTIGNVDYSAFTYDKTAHITELDLTDEQLNILQNGALSLVMSKSNLGVPVILNENFGTPLYCVEVRPVRMEGNPGTTATSKVYVSKNGRPLANKKLDVFVEGVKGTTPGATVPPTNPGNTTQGDGALTAEISASDENGFATVTLTVAKNPGKRTVELDGQLYFVIVYDPDEPMPDWSKVTPQQDTMLSVLVWSQYEVNPNPKWEEIQSIFAPYMKLFPSMKSQIDLTDLNTFTIFTNNPPWDHSYNEPNPGPLGINAGAIPYYFTRDFNDPRFMPITRDLSPSKIMTVLHFCKNLQNTPLT